MEEALIAAVKKRPSLYEKSQDNSSNRNYVNKHWVNIAKDIGVEGFPSNCADCAGEIPGLSPVVGLTGARFLRGGCQGTRSLASCLTTSDGEVPNETIPKLPNDQCKAYNGPESFTCRGTGLPSLEQVCDGILCRQAGSAFICNQLSTASGTCCGNGKMCKAGRCQAAESGQCVMD
ncbi:uncharacterized protein LOC101845739, partial [Aplysia californica]|uniref:Uncharacterized protein LOC101845739 n=1 Tax=Aplysia californica TaxID=6500 RepID=A0ABM0K9I1_APLCA